jgi:hypothetical protein
MSIDWYEVHCVHHDVGQHRANILSIWVDRFVSRRGVDISLHTGHLNGVDLFHTFHKGIVAPRDARR